MFFIHASASEHLGYFHVLTVVKNTTMNMKVYIALSDFIFPFHFHALEKEMATHSSVLAWRIPGTGEPGGLTSTGLHRAGLNWSDLAAKVNKSFAKRTY